jgi:hypothetical protein
MMNLISRKLRSLFGLQDEVPDINDYDVTTIKMAAHANDGYVLVVSTPHDTPIFSYRWIDGVNANRYGKLWRWHKVYQDQIDQRISELNEE